MEDAIPFYKTSDSFLASTLYTLGFPIDGIFAVPNSQRKEFYFKETPEVMEAIEKYYKREIRTEPMVLLTNWREIVAKLKHDQINFEKPA